MTPIEQMPGRGPELKRVDMLVCVLCLAGKEGECHSPGCAFFICAAPTSEQAARFQTVEHSAGCPAADALKRVRDLQATHVWQGRYAVFVKDVRDALNGPEGRASWGCPCRECAA